MNEPADTPRVTPPTDLEEHAVTRLLELGLAEPRRPVDALIDRLGAADGMAWFTRFLASGPLAETGDAESAILDGAAQLDQLGAIKERSKELLADAIAEDDRLAGLAGYFLTIAAGLAHHGANLSSRSLADLRPVLLDLASVCPEAWSRLLTRAIEDQSEQD